MKKNNLFNLGIIILLFFTFVILSIISYQNMYLQATTVPDFLLLKTSVSNIRESGTMVVKNSFNCDNISNENIFGPRGYIVTEDCSMVHGLKGHLLIYQFSTVSFYNMFYLYFLIPLIFSVALIFFIKLCLLYFSKKITLLLSCLFVFSAPFFFWSTIPFTNLGAISFYIISLYYFLKAIKERLTKFYILSSVFVFITVISRYEYALFFLPFCFFLLGKKFDLKKMAIFIFLSVVLVISLIISNILLYDNFLFSLTGHPGGITTPDERYSSDNSEFIFRVVELFKIYFFEILAGISVLFILSLFLYLYSKGKMSDLNIFTVGLSVIIISIAYLFVGKFSGWSFESIAIGSSYSRYLLPVYFFMVFLSGFFLEKNFFKVECRKYIFALLLIFFIIFSINIVYFSDLGLTGDTKSFRDGQKIFTDTKNQYFQNFSNNSFVFTKYLDKYVYPDAIPMAYHMINKSYRKQTVLDLTDALVNRNYSVFITKDDYFDADPIEDYLQMFINNGYDINEKNGYLYELIKNETKI